MSAIQHSTRGNLTAEYVINPERVSSAGFRHALNIQLALTADVTVFLSQDEAARLAAVLLDALDAAKAAQSVDPMRSDR